MTALALQASLEEKAPILVSRIINSKAFKESREKRNVPKFEEDEYHFQSSISSIQNLGCGDSRALENFFELSMVYIVVNGLIVEAKTVTEIHMQMEVKRHRVVYSRKKYKSLKEDDTITDIVREAIKQMKGE